MNAEWRWDFAIEILPNMLWATLNTILAAGNWLCYCSNYGA
jgi:polar amino acid transport system permease protein